jgi:hypothetical protein
MREGDQRWLVLWGLGMERPREGKVGACGSGRWRCSVAVGKEMGVEKKRIPKPGRVAMEAGGEGKVSPAAGWKNQNQGGSVWFLFGKNMVLAERLCAGRMRPWLGVCGQ